MTSDLRTNGAAAPQTLVELTWREKRIEHRIRFGRIVSEQRIDPSRRIVAFAPGSIFAFVRWAGNEHGTVISRIDIVRAVATGEAFQMLPFVRPGGAILLRVNGWPKVEMVLRAIDAIEALDVNSTDAAPEYWRHVHNRITANQPFRIYTREQHRAWLRRRELLP